MADHNGPEFDLLDHDVPLDLVQGFAASEDRLSQEEWEILTSGLPNLRQFIESRSVGIAPNDPELRASVTKSMLGLLALLGEARMTEQLERTLSEEWTAGSGEDKVA